MIISLLSFHVVSEIRSCWGNLQPVFLEILGWCDHCIIYNSEPYLKDLFFSWIHLRGQSLRGAWLRLSGGLEKSRFPELRGTIFPPIGTGCAPGVQGFRSAAPEHHVLNIDQTPVAAFAAVLELGEPLLGNFVRDHWLESVDMIRVTPSKWPWCVVLITNSDVELS